MNTIVDRLSRWWSGGHDQPEDPATPIAQCTKRERVRVSGTVDAAGINPTTGWFEAHLVDASGDVRLVWMGRTKLAGITEGTRLAATGTLCVLDGNNALYNPEFQVLPSKG